jgi:hypothetical protein
VAGSRVERVCYLVHGCKKQVPCLGVLGRGWPAEGFWGSTTPQQQHRLAACAPRCVGIGTGSEGACEWVARLGSHPLQLQSCEAAQVS